MSEINKVIPKGVDFSALSSFNNNNNTSSNIETFDDYDSDVKQAMGSPVEQITEQIIEIQEQNRVQKVIINDAGQRIVEFVDGATGSSAGNNRYQVTTPDNNQVFFNRDGQIMQIKVGESQSESISFHYGSDGTITSIYVGKQAAEKLGLNFPDIGGGYNDGVYSKNDFYIIKFDENGKAYTNGTITDSSGNLISRNDMPVSVNIDNISELASSMQENYVDPYKNLLDRGIVS